MRSMSCTGRGWLWAYKNVALLNTLTEKKTVVSRLPMRNNIMQESAKSRHGFTWAHFQRTQLRALTDWKQTWHRQNKKTACFFIVMQRLYSRTDTDIVRVQLQ